MGILYSHFVFQPPSPPTYSDDAGVMSFRKARLETDESEDDDSPRTDASNAGSYDSQLVQHPVMYLKTARGNTIPVAYFHQPDSYFTILFSHGNGEDLGVTSSYALELSSALKTSVLCYDYSGYGLSTGKPSELNCYADIHAAYNYLVAERRIPPKRVLLFGRSLGSGPTIELASRLGHNLGGIVLIAALSSCVRVVFNSPTTMKFDMFTNIDKIDRIEMPIFCVHGMADEVVPFSHGVDLSRRCKYAIEPLWIRNAGHNNLESSRFQKEVFTRYMSVLEEFGRWRPPSVHTASTTRRRESTGALALAAGCFGVSKNAQAGLEGEARVARRRLRHPASVSGSQLVMPPFSGGKHEADVKALWCKRDEGLARRRSAGDTRTQRKSRGSSFPPQPELDSPRQAALAL